MPRKPRIQFEYAWYHVINHGANEKKLFDDSEQQETFLSLLHTIHSRYEIEIHAYCLMDNHYHLMLCTPKANLDQGMQYLNGVYTQKYNKLTSSNGSLFRGRYYPQVIDADNYLLQVSRYIHLNPVKAHMVKRPEEFTWSSYNAYINKVEPPSWLTINTTLEMISNNKELALNEYKNFVEDAPTDLPSPLKSMNTPSILGSSEFIQKVVEKNNLEDS